MRTPAPARPTGPRGKRGASPSVRRPLRQLQTNAAIVFRKAALLLPGPTTFGVKIMALA